MTARWYMVNKIGMATLCTDEADARLEAAKADQNYPLHRPHRAVQLVERQEVERITAATREECAKQLDSLGCDHCAAALRHRGTP